MTTFILKKYNPPEPKPEGESVSETETENREPDQTLKINTSASIAETIAAALYKALPNSVKVEEVPEDQEAPAADDVNVISTEDINGHPVDTYRQVAGKQTIAVISQEQRAFSTEAENWFLTNVMAQNPTMLYTVPGLMAHVNQKLGI